MQLRRLEAEAKDNGQRSTSSTNGRQVMATGFPELQRKIGAIADNRVVRKAILSLFSEWHSRIYTEGEAVSGKIGSYNTTDPLYVNPADSPRSFPTLGKPRKDGSRRKGKTGWFPSYAAFRKDIGRPTGFVNLQLTEQMKRATVVGFRGQSMVFGFTNQTEADKGAGNEKHFKKQIFRLSRAEIASIPRRMASARKELGL